MPIALPAAMLISAAIGAAGSAASAKIGSNAAKSAAQIQAEAAAKAGQQIVDTTASVNPQIGAAAERAALGTEEAVRDANTRLDPFSAAGTTAVNALNLGVAPGGEFNKTPTMEDIQIDPGFAFRLQQAQKALGNSAAARTGALSGAAVKSLDLFTQGDASQEYAAAEKRFQDSVTGRYSRVAGVAGMGLSAAGKQGDNAISGTEWGGAARVSAADQMAQNTINAERTRGDYLTGGAAATAAGKVGSANAWETGLGGAAGAGMNALVMNSILKQPAAAPNTAPVSVYTPPATPYQPPVVSSPQVSAFQLPSWMPQGSSGVPVPKPV